MIFCLAIEYFRGSQNGPDKRLFRTVGVAMIGTAVLTAFLVAYHADRYCWIENETVISINKNVLCSGELKCTGVEISGNSKDSYFGKATLSDGSTVPIVVTYKFLRWRSYSTSYQVSEEFK